MVLRSDHARMSKDGSLFKKNMWQIDSTHRRTLFQAWNALQKMKKKKNFSPVSCHYVKLTIFSIIFSSVFLLKDTELGSQFSFLDHCHQQYFWFGEQNNWENE